MPVSLLKAPAVPASQATGYVVVIPGLSWSANVQSVRNAQDNPGHVVVTFHDDLGFARTFCAAGAALTLSADQGETAAFLR